MGRVLIQQSIYAVAVIGLKSSLAVEIGFAGFDPKTDFHLQWGGLSILAEVSGAAQLVKLMSFGSVGTISVLAGSGAPHWERLPWYFSFAVIPLLGVCC